MRHRVLVNGEQVMFNIVDAFVTTKEFDPAFDINTLVQAFSLYIICKEHKEAKIIELQCKCGKQWYTILTHTGECK